MTKRELFDKYQDYPDMVTTKQMMEICNISRRRSHRLIINEALRHEYIDPEKGNGHKNIIVNKLDVLNLLYKRLCLHNPDDHYRSVATKYYTRFFKDEPDVLTSPQVVELLGYRKQTIQRWLLNGELPSFRRYERYRILKSDLINFVISGRYRAIIKKSITHKFCEEEIVQEMRAKH